MPWLDSHLDQHSHLGQEPGAQSAAEASQALSTPEATPGGAEVPTPSAAPVPKFFGLTKQQWVLVAAVAVVVYFLAKKRGS